MAKKGEDELGISNKALAGLSVGILVIFLLLIAFMYFWVKKGKGGIIFPAGINYTGAETTPPPAPPRPKYDLARIATLTSLVTFESSRKQYKFDHPGELIPLIFPGDPNDSMTFDVVDLPVQFNLMALVETISVYEPKLTGDFDEFVKKYYTFFPGLKGAGKLESYTSPKGLRGFKTTFVNQADQNTNENYFFQVPGKPDKILHLVNIFPSEGKAIFDKILSSIELVP